MSRLTMLLTFIAVLMGSLLLTATTASAASAATSLSASSPDGHCCLTA